MKVTDPGALHFVLWMMKHGYKCWIENHPYFHDHTRGSWREWLCGK